MKTSDPGFSTTPQVSFYPLWDWVYTHGISGLTIPSSSLVMNAANWIVCHHFHTRSQGPVQFLLHFSISTLNCSKVQLWLIVTLNLNRWGSTPTNANTVDGAAQLHNLHPYGRMKTAKSVICEISPYGRLSQKRKLTEQYNQSTPFAAVLTNIFTWLRLILLSRTTKIHSEVWKMQWEENGSHVMLAAPYCIFWTLLELVILQFWEHSSNLTKT